jgi:two-component system response regulator ChvI
MHLDKLAALDPALGAVSQYRPRGKRIRDVPDVAFVDDDDHYREVLAADLADRGFAVSSFADGPSFLEALGNGIEAQVALLDWVLPEMSGFDLLVALRERRIGMPVVFLTGHPQVELELQALDRGAVDFVDKARGVEVLAHRLRIIVESQRASGVATRQAGPGDDGIQGRWEPERYGDLTLHPKTARALWREHDVGLTITEYKMVVHLVAHIGQPQTYRALYDTAYYQGFIAGSGERGYSINVRSMIKRIRRKFQAVDPSFAEIRNEHRVGYCWQQSKHEPR